MTKKHNALLLGLLISLGWTASPEAQNSPLPKRKPNILMIVLDDQNDWVGPLGGHPDVQTPHMDELARRGVTFTNAHAQAPACNPSRASLLSGLRPTTTGIYANRSRWRRGFQGHPTMPQFFEERRFLTVAYGKVNKFEGESLWEAEHKPRAARNLGEVEKVGDLSWRRLEASETKTADFRTSRQVEEFLKRDSGEPFLMVCGFVRPHVPWSAPTSYFELYPDPALPEVKADDLEDIPAAGLTMRASEGESHGAILEADAWSKAVQAYLASTSFVDAMIGRVMAALDEGPNAENTIVVFLSDHGFHLGEKNHWRKFTLWEESTRVPLIIIAPTVTKPGTVCERPVELVDLYRTLAELCELEAPEKTDGESLVALLKEPETPWPHAAITTNGRGNHSVRTERWRYIRYADGSEELYDHESDPNEWTNLAADPELAGVRAELAAHLPAEEAEPTPSATKRR